MLALHLREYDPKERTHLAASQMQPDFHKEGVTFMWTQSMQQRWKSISLSLLLAGLFASEVLPAQAQPETPDALAFNTANVKPVSYTHLDVYKRQIRSRS